jgi:DNA-binding response OmpR family regulator
MAKILIVEDDEAQQFLYQVELQEEGYEVILAKKCFGHRCLQISRPRQTV